LNRVDVELEIKVAKSGLKAILFHDGDKDVWLPKSQIAIKRHCKPDELIKLLECVTVNMPEWLAKEKGLI
jgi:hypothetical protein